MPEDRPRIAARYGGAPPFEAKDLIVAGDRWRDEKRAQTEDLEAKMKNTIRRQFKRRNDPNPVTRNSARFSIGFWIMLLRDIRKAEKKITQEILYGKPPE